MDNSPSRPQPSALRWTTSLSAVAIALVGVVAAVALALFSSRTGVVFWSLVALCLTTFAGHVLRARPRLSADACGVTVRGTLHTYRLEHGQLRVLVRRTNRLGREGLLLELDGIDTGGEERLLLLGRFDLGADPADVLAQLERLRGD